MSAAYILHKRAYRESSSILEVFTRDYGRVSLMARGARGKRSKLAGSLLLFKPLVISWQGKGSLPYLKNAEAAELNTPVLKNKALLCAMYVNELLMYLLHKDDVHEAVFDHYHHCLYSLEEGDNFELTLRIFESRLLELLGFGLSLHADADTGEAIDANAMYDYHFEYGPVKNLHTSTGIVPKISGECLLAMANEDYQAIADSPGHLAELKQLMRFIIGQYLGNKKLKSRELFKLAGQA